MNAIFIIFLGATIFFVHSVAPGAGSFSPERMGIDRNLGHSLPCGLSLPDRRDTEVNIGWLILSRFDMKRTLADTPCKRKDLSTGSLILSSCRFDRWENRRFFSLLAVEMAVVMTAAISFLLCLPVSGDRRICANHHPRSM